MFRFVGYFDLSKAVGAHGERANHTDDATWLALAQQGKAGNQFCREFLA